MRFTAVLAALVLTALVFCGACGSGGGAAAAPVGPNTVKVADFAFSPTSLTVHVGETVTWDFRQPDAPHNVVSLNGPASFNSGVPQGRGTYKFTFTQPGTYTYDCQVHPSMLGTVVDTP